MSNKQQMASLLALASCVAIGAGCSSDKDALPTSAPSGVSLVTRSGFVGPSDAVITPHGDEIFFTAFTDDEARSAAIFRVDAAGGDPSILHEGAPLAYTTGLVMSCDGAQLFVADMGISSADDETQRASFDTGAVYKVSTRGGDLERIEIAGLARPSGLAMGPDCETLYISGWNESGVASLFSSTLDGGGVRVIYEGAPLGSPTGMYVDSDKVAWVLDRAGSTGTGTLYAIDDRGEISDVASGMRFGMPAGCSLTAGGGTAVIPTFDAAGGAQLTTIDIATGTVEELEAPDLVAPAGLRTAREAGVFAVVDSVGNAIYRAE